MSDTRTATARQIEFAGQAGLPITEATPFEEAHERIARHIETTPLPPTDAQIRFIRQLTKGRMSREDFPTKARASAWIDEFKAKRARTQSEGDAPTPDGEATSDGPEKTATAFQRRYGEEHGLGIGRDTPYSEAYRRVGRHMAAGRRRLKAA